MWYLSFVDFVIRRPEVRIIHYLLRVVNTCKRMLTVTVRSI